MVEHCSENKKGSRGRTVTTSSRRAKQLLLQLSPQADATCFEFVYFEEPVELSVSPRPTAPIPTFSDTNGRTSFVHGTAKCQSSSNCGRCITMLAPRSLVICTVSFLVAYLMLVTFGPEEFESNEVQDVFRSRTLESNVQCLETIPGNRRIILMGDSRVRQLFFSFVQLFPDYDFIWDGLVMRELPFLTAATVNSSLMNLTMSFKWNPFLEESLSDLISWTSDSIDQTPHLLIMGMASHYVVNKRVSRDNPFGDFEKTLQEIAPLLKKIAARCKIAWLNQLPLIEREAKWNQEILLRYDRAARTILRDAGVTFLDLDVDLGEQYVLACNLNWRDDPLEYQNCIDYVHTGYVALDRRSNFLLDFFCNRPASQLQ